MKYKLKYDHLNRCLNSVQEKEAPLCSTEALNLMRDLVDHLMRDSFDWGHKCELEDGRTRWMVRYDKYLGVKEALKASREREDELKEEIKQIRITQGESFL